MIININTDINNEKMEIDDDYHSMLELLYILFLFYFIFIYFP